MKKIFKYFLIFIVIIIAYAIYDGLRNANVDWDRIAKENREELREKNFEREAKKAREEKERAESIPTSTEIHDKGFVYKIYSWDMVDGNDDVKLAKMGMNLQDSKEFTYIIIELSVQNKTKEAKVFNAGNLALKFGANAPLLLKVLDTQAGEGYGHTKIVPANFTGTTIFAYRIPTNLFNAKDSKIYYIPVGYNNYGLYVMQHKAKVEAAEE